MGDPGEISQLLARHRHGLLAYLHTVLHDGHAVEDVFQELCLVAIRKADEYRPGTAFPAWARAIARLKALEWLRVRRGIRMDESLLEGIDRAFAEARPEADLEARKGALRDCLGRLPDRSRRLLLLRYEEGLTPDSIAGRTHRSRASVNSLLQRIRETLRDCVQRRLAGAGAP